MNERQPRGNKRPKKERKLNEKLCVNHDKLTSLPEEWMWVSLGSIFDISSGGTPRRDKPEYWKGNIPWVSSGEVAFNDIVDTHECITKEGMENSSAKIYPSGTVLLALYGEGKTRGQVAILRKPATTNQAIGSILVSRTVVPPEYVFWWLVYRYLETRSVGAGGNQPNMYLRQVREIPIPLAPYQELIRITKRIVELFFFINSIEKAIEVAVKKSKKMDQAILAKAFRGELVPQDPNDEPASVLLERIKAQA